MQIQRSLQLQIEEQGRYLQMMIDKQHKMQQEKIKDTSAPSPDLSQVLPKATNSVNEKLKMDQFESPSGATRKRAREDYTSRD